MAKKTSIHDIARHLQVSAATVSYVLNGKSAEKRISPAMEKKVLDYVEEIGYRPNRVAKSLRTGKSKLIGMLVEDISDPFFAGIARIIEANAHRHDYKIFHASTENDPRITRDLIQVFRDTQVDGYIIAPAPGTEADIQALMDDNLPVVLFDRYFPTLPTYNVVTDNEGGAFEATCHLLNNGYRRPAFVTLDSEQSQMNDRMTGYLKAVTAERIEPVVLKILYKMEREKDVAEKIEAFLQEHPEVDSVLFATNYLTIGGLLAIRHRGIQIPDEMGVIGFDDSVHLSLLSPSVSAVAQPVAGMSETVIEVLMKCLNTPDKQLPAETIVLPASLVLRQSSMAMRKCSPPSSVWD